MPGRPKTMAWKVDERCRRAGQLAMALLDAMPEQHQDCPGCDDPVCQLWHEAVNALLDAPCELCRLRGSLLAKAGIAPPQMTDQLFAEYRRSPRSRDISFVRFCVECAAGNGGKS
jgi:hypothetical protein